MILEKINKNILLTSLLLFITIVIFESTDLDIQIQELFYNYDTKLWILDRNEVITKFIFYDGIKKLLIFFAVVVLFILLIFRKKELIKKYRIGLLIVLLSSIFIPIIIGGLKNITNTPCPKNISHFDGNYPNIKVCDKYPEEFKQESRIKCWPAGHASGGFALLSLFFLFKSKKNKNLALVTALIIGWSMGTYKMLIGDHFLSHTIITMIIAWLTILVIVKIFQIIEGKNIEKSTQI